MKKILLASGAALALSIPLISLAAVPWSDDFSLGTIADATKWHIPIWTGPTDGTYIYPTQFRTSQNAPLPSLVSGNALIKLETYNPTGASYYGTDLLSNDVFVPAAGQTLEITFRAKLDNIVPGTVAGLSLYALKPGSTTIHDEIDFELLGKRPNYVHTNIYGNEPLGEGHPASTLLPAGSTIGSYHTYKIRWSLSKVEWYIDGALVRTATANVPQGPMHIHLNFYVNGNPLWTDAYSNAITPYTTDPNQNVVWTMSVDSVSVAVVTTGATPTASFTNAPSCIVPSGSDICPLTLSWTSANPSAGTVGLYSCSGSMTAVTPAGPQSRLLYLTPLRTCWQIRNMGTGAILAQTTVNVTCAAGTTWANGMCSPPTPPPTASFTSVPSCTIAAGASYCLAPVSWTSANVPSGMVSLFECGTSMLDIRGLGPQTSTQAIRYWGRCFNLINTGTNQIMATINGTASCAAGAYWTGYYCFKP